MDMGVEEGYGGGRKGGKMDAIEGGWEVPFEPEPEPEPVSSRNPNATTTQNHNLNLDSLKLPTSISLISHISPPAHLSPSCISQEAQHDAAVSDAHGLCLQ